MTKASLPLSGLRVLVIEDDWVIAEDLAQELERFGADVVGPVESVDRALHHVRTGAPIDFALVDVYLDGQPSYEVADVLQERGVPFVFATGSDPSGTPDRFRGIGRCQKPFRPSDLSQVIAAATSPAIDINAQIRVKQAANQLLAALPDSDMARLRPHMTRRRLITGEMLYRPGDRLERVYFPESGLISVTTESNAGSAEVGVVGREGMIGGSFALGIGTTRFGICVQIEGEAIVVGADAVRALVEESSEFRNRLLRFNHVFHVQVAYTASANAGLTIERRLARWILMCADRVGDEIRITHEFLAQMLNVRRAGVTNALHILEGIGAIRSSRGQITIRNRTTLLGQVDDAYGVPEAEYKRLLTS